MSDYETQARRRKARTIANCCREHGWSGSDVVNLNATERADLCTIAGVNVASAKTWAVVIGMLGAMEPTR